MANISRTDTISTCWISTHMNTHESESWIKWNSFLFLSYFVSVWILALHVHHLFFQSMRFLFLICVSFFSRNVMHFVCMDHELIIDHFLFFHFAVLFPCFVASVLVYRDVGVDRLVQSPLRLFWCCWHVCWRPVPWDFGIQLNSSKKCVNNDISFPWLKETNFIPFNPFLNHRKRSLAMNSIIHGTVFWEKIRVSHTIGHMFWLGLELRSV